MATAEALAYSLDIPLVGVDTLAVMAYNLPVPGVQLVPVLDAQKGNVYVGRYVWEKEQLKEVKPVEILAVKELPKVLEQEPLPSVILGECRGIVLTDCRKPPLWPF
jgi:tRNA threonylcarbamoyladenosine biosynthesis protein TsaB